MDEIKKDVSMDLDILNCLDITRSKKRLFVIETEGKVRDIGLQVSIFFYTRLRRVLLSLGKLHCNKIIMTEKPKLDFSASATVLSGRLHILLQPSFFGLLSQGGVVQSPFKFMIKSKLIS